MRNEEICMQVNPGELDKKIQIVKLIQEKNENGFYTEQKEKIVRSCFAKRTTTSGTEANKSGTEFSETKQRFLVRYSSKEIDTDMYVRYCGKLYNIVYINDYSGKEYIEIWAESKEMVGNG